MHESVAGVGFVCERLAEFCNSHVAAVIAVSTAHVRLRWQQTVKRRRRRRLRRLGGEIQVFTLAMVTLAIQESRRRLSDLVVSSSVR